MKKFSAIIFFIYAALYGCGQAYDDGTGDGRYIDWGYESRYRGATWQAASTVGFDTKFELAKGLIAAIDYGYPFFKKAYSAIDTWLLLDNVTYPERVEEEGTCTGGSGGLKIFDTQPFLYEGTYFETTVNFQNYCVQGLSDSEKVSVNGSARAREEFIGTHERGSPAQVYFEMYMDNLSVSGAASGSLYGILSRLSARAKGSKPDGDNEGNNTDFPSVKRLGLDFNYGGEVNRFDIYDNSSSSPKKYIEYFNNNYGSVRAALPGFSGGADKPSDFEEISMIFSDNSTCVFTRYDLQKQQSQGGYYDKWFNCKSHNYEPSYPY